MKVRFWAQPYRYYSACVFLLMALGVQAKNLGTAGTTFEIEEPDLLQVIERKLSHLQQSGQWVELQKKWQQKVEASVDRPTPVSDVKHTVKFRTFYFDPSITLSENLVDHRGQLIHKAGTRVNPLQTTALTRALLFLDGDDKAQVHWALKEFKKRKDKAILILVKGSPLKLMKQATERFYFDQAGELTEKFGIQQVPAIVTQAGLRLKVEEVAL